MQINTLCLTSHAMWFSKHWFKQFATLHVAIFIGIPSIKIFAKCGECSLPMLEKCWYLTPLGKNPSSLAKTEHATLLHLCKRSQPPLVLVSLSLPQHCQHLKDNHFDSYGVQTYFVVAMIIIDVTFVDILHYSLRDQSSRVIAQVITLNF